MNPHSAATDPLQGLRDIHLPAPVSFWPPAPGWWLLAGGLIVLLSLGLWWWRRQRRRRYRSQALHAIQDVRREWQAGRSDNETLASVSVLLRRVAITRYGRRQVAALHGKAWLDFLDQTGDGTDFLARGQDLLDAPYRPGTARAAETVLALATQWVKVQS